MIGSIGFDHLKIQCIIGDLPEERLHEQEIFVDLRVKINISSSGESDDLKDTIDYVYLHDLCETMAKNRQYKLLETFVYEVAKTILENGLVEEIFIRVKKPKGLSHTDFSVVELTHRVDGR